MENLDYGWDFSMTCKVKYYFGYWWIKQCTLPSSLLIIHMFWLVSFRQNILDNLKCKTTLDGKQACLYYGSLFLGTTRSLTALVSYPYFLHFSVVYMCRIHARCRSRRHSRRNSTNNFSPGRGWNLFSKFLPTFSPQTSCLGKVIVLFSQELAKAR